MLSLHDLKRAVILAPEDVDARFALAERLYADGDANAATTQLEKALAIAPDHGNTARLLARIYERGGKQPRAQALLEELVRQAPRDPHARDELVGFHLAAGRLDDAIVHAAEAVHCDADDVRRHLFLADLLRQRDLPARARGVLEAARARFPNDRAVAEELAELMAAEGDLVALDGAYFRAQTHELRDGHIAAMVRDTPLASVSDALVTGRLADARRTLAALSDAVRETAVGRLLDGELALLDGAYDAAETRFRAALEAKPGLALAWNRLGDLARLQHALPRAALYYKKAVLNDPDDTNALTDLGDVLAQLGEHAAAMTSYRRALAKDAACGAQERLSALAQRLLGTSDQAAVGRIGALGWHPTGGAVSPLEAVAVPGRGELILSGNVGPTGREAATVAFSVIKARAHELAIADLVPELDLHLHFTDTAFGKDGPSAGLALVLAGVSAYTKKPLRTRLAATGEVTLHGQIQKVGGIHEKLIAAHLAGLTTIILPRGNTRDARALPPGVLAALTLIHVDSVADAIARALA